MFSRNRCRYFSRRARALVVEISDLVFLGVFVGKSEVFKMSGIFRGNPGTDFDPSLEVIPIRLQTVKS